MFNPYGMYTCGNFIPIFPKSDVNQPVFRPLKESEIPDLPYLNEYTGELLDSRPTFNTLTHDPTGMRKTFKVGNIIWSDKLQQNIISCHEQGYYGSQNNVYRDSTGRRQRY